MCKSMCKSMCMYFGKASIYLQAACTHTQPVFVEIVLSKSNLGAYNVIFFYLQF